MTKETFLGIVGVVLIALILMTSWMVIKQNKIQRSSKVVSVENQYNIFYIVNQEESDYSSTQNADHRKQRGRTAPNRALRGNEED